MGYISITKGAAVNIKVERISDAAYRTYTALDVTWRDVVYAGLEALVRRANRRQVEREPRQSRARGCGQEVVS